MVDDKRLIDANALQRLLLPIATGLEREYGSLGGAVSGVMKHIDSAPTVDAVEVVHGQWEPREDVKGFVRCSVCHDCNIYDDWPDGKKWNYCPNCGALMEDKNESVS